MVIFHSSCHFHASRYKFLREHIFLFFYPHEPFVYACAEELAMKPSRIDIALMDRVTLIVLAASQTVTYEAGETLFRVINSIR